MAKHIFKYTVPVADNFSIGMPIGAEILTVKMQSGLPQMWAIVDTDAAKESRSFCVYGTGNGAPPTNARYIDTFLMHDDALVWHLFETT